MRKPTLLSFSSLAVSLSLHQVGYRTCLSYTRIRSVQSSRLSGYQEGLLARLFIAFRQLLVRRSRLRQSPAARQGLSLRLLTRKHTVIDSPRHPSAKLACPARGVPSLLSRRRVALPSLLLRPGLHPAAAAPPYHRQLNQVLFASKLPTRRSPFRPPEHLLAQPPRVRRQGQALAS